MEIIRAVAVLLIWLICGVLAWGLLLGDILAQCEEIYQKQGVLGGKIKKSEFKVIIATARIVRIIFGVFCFVSTCVYRLIMREKFHFAFSLPKDFWTKYFSDDEKL